MRALLLALVRHMAGSQFKSWKPQLCFYFVLTKLISERDLRIVTSLLFMHPRHALTLQIAVLHSSAATPWGEFSCFWQTNIVYWAIDKILP